ncbi:unnamed protein product [Prorocentrum cordatum]|uniref:Transglutaminase-like domain-containing protein n=1 Tax=Prorocentrum cordatum TaxID=2364126 RepID=A0ABN9S6E9_9DINO|nr:unnamed protein product [Polarella glacialis]
MAQLLRWFKADCFRWVDRLPCAACGSASTEDGGPLEPSEAERARGADRVEAHRCRDCGAVGRFPRYGDPLTLLETRRGRCGEWANCFTLLAAALGFEARLVLDWTDHVWTEFLGQDGRWRHCDPCEGRMDSPLLYEAGWGKELTYVFAFSPAEVVDVTPRYTAVWPEVLARRGPASEADLAGVVEDLDARARAGAAPPPWRAPEARELAAARGPGAGREAGAAELAGRETGSVDWRLARGEMGPRAAAASLGGEPGALLAAAARPGAAVVGRLCGGARLCCVGGVPALELLAPGACVEVEGLPQQVGGVCAATGDGAFTVEAWLRARPAELRPEGFQNPLFSQHGPGSGWELRLLRRGVVCFLVTVDGVHHEVDAGAAQWPPDGWVHVAGVFTGERADVFVGGQRAGALDVPAGRRSHFEGPPCLGRNPAWRDRGARCLVAAARTSRAALEPRGFLPAPRGGSAQE